MKNLSIVSLMVCVLTLTSGSAGLIFSDNFNTADNTDINQNLATRQSGTIGTQSWVETAADSEIKSNRLEIPKQINASNDGNVYLNYDFSGAAGLLDGGVFTIAFDLDGVDTSYTTFFLGGADLSGRPLVSSGTDFGMLLDTDSSSSPWQAGSDVGDTAATGTGNNAFEFTVTTDNFNNGTAYTIDLLLNASVYDLNGAPAGTSISGTWDGGQMIIGFSTRSNFGDRISEIDNFAVTAIPEPSTGFLLLLSTGAFYLLTRKSRTTV